MVQLYKRKGGEVLVNTETLNTQSGPIIANLSGGGFVITWSDNSLIGGDASSFAVKAQLFDANGGKVGSEFLVNTTTTGNQSGPSAVGLASGRFVITWSDASATGGDTSSNAVRGQLFEANGTPVGSEFLINTVTAGSQSVPSITELAGGGFVIGWTDASATGADNSGSGIKAQLFDASGAKVGGEFLVNTVISGSQSSAHVIALGTGFAVSWAGAVTSSGGITSGSVRLQLFDAAGVKVGTEQVVNASNDGNFTTLNMSVLGSGFIVTWSQQDSEQAPGIPVTFDIHAQLFDANGVKVGSEFIVNTTTAGTQSAAEARLLPDGGFIVAWSGPGEGTSGTNVFGQFFDAAGHKVGPEVVIAGGDNTQNGSRVDVLPNGDIVVIYNDAGGTGGDASATGIKMQILTLSTDAPTDILLTTAGITEVSIENLAVATLAATNASAINSQFTYAIVSDSSNGAFRIDGDQLVIDDSSKLDFETAPTVDVRIRVTDLNGASYEETLTLDIGNSVTEVRYSAGDEILVTTDSHESSGTRAIATLASGGFAVLTAWGDFFSGGGQGQRVQVYDAAGVPVGAGHEYDLGRGGATTVMAGLPSGGFVIAYEGDSINVPGGNSFPINAQLFDADGNKVGSEILVSSTNVGILVSPVVTLLSNGNFVIGWNLLQDEADPQAFGSQVVAQLFDGDGDKVGGEFRLNTGIENSQGGVQVAALPDGGFFASWSEQEAGNARFEGQIFDAAGAKVGGEILLLSVPVGDDDPVGAYHLTALADGNVLFTWAELISEEPSAYALQARVVTPAGAVGDDLSLFVSPEPFFDVAALPDGGFAITLAAPADEGGLNHVGAQFFDAAGVPIGNPFEVPQGETEGMSDPLIVVLASGDVVIAYDGPAKDGQSLSDTFARIFTVQDDLPTSTTPTEGPDTLTGTPNADTIDGLGGNDVINGLGGDDILTGGAGDDIVHGGNGNDVITELDGGNDQLFGDDGADRIIVSFGQTTTIDAGTGADLVQVDVMVGQQITLGTGVNLVAFSDQGFQDGIVTIHDFTAGNGGDVINLAGILISNTPASTIDPFASGAIQLTQEGANAVLRIDTDFIAGNLTATIVLENVLASSLTAYNLAGYSPGGSATSDLVLTGAADPDFLTGQVGNDLISGQGGDDVLFGAAGNDTLQGGQGSDTLYGQYGNDVLDGGAGADVMAGGVGNDTYVLDNAGDTIVEEASRGYDAIYTTISYALNDTYEVESLVALDYAGTAPLTLTGNGLANYLLGNAGDNQLNGGAGADALEGRGGNDVYVIDNVGDLAIEYAGGGIDAIYTSVSYALNDAYEVENLVALDAASTAPLALTGNSIANYLLGNAGANQLNGAAGADAMEGRGGNDVYVVDNAGDLVIEYAGGGIDAVYTTVSYALNDTYEVESLVALDFAGTAPLTLTGNSLANYLLGNAGANQLNGGAGADALEGRGGNDVYVVDNVGDVVIEAAGGGVDAVYTTVSYALAAGQEVESLVALNFAGTNALNLTGNGVANYIIGNDGANILNGGAGSDALEGRGGADTFVFADALGPTNIDYLGDFNAVDDTINLDHNVFAGLGLGALDPNAFFAGTAAHDADDRIIYDQATGRLWFDADGAGGNAAVLFANLGGSPALSASDFVVI